MAQGCLCQDMSAIIEYHNGGGTEQRIPWVPMAALGSQKMDWLHLVVQ